MNERQPTPEITVKDFVGNLIRPNDVVAYPVRRGSNMWMNLITVTLVQQDRITGYNSVGRTIHVTNLSNIVVVVVPPKSEAPDAAV